MTLWAYRDTKAERLVERLADALASHWPADPMDRVRLVIGSRGMQRWLSHELATLQGSLAAVDFLFPGNAFTQASEAVFAAAGEPGSATAPAASAADDAWSGAALHRRVIPAIRARLTDPAFQRVHGYLGDCNGPVGAREWAFTREVAAVLQRLLYDRPDDAEAWRADPSAAGEHRWLAQLLVDLMAGAPPTDPPSRLARLRSLPAQRVPAPLFVFGLSSLRHGDKVHLAELARHMDIHLFMLVPSTEWWADIRLRTQERAALRHAQAQAQRSGGGAAQVIELLRGFERSNALLAAHGAPSRDLQLWLEDLGYQTVDDAPEAGPPRHRLQALQQWIDAADETPGLRERLHHNGLLESDAGPLPSLEINACHGALRQCEALRDDLLRRFAADPTLEPRHVLVMTPDLATYAPLIAAVFGREPRAEAAGAQAAGAQAAGAQAVPTIPVHIADLGLTDTNPVAAVLLDVIGLVGSRVTASKLLDLLGREPLRAKFRIDDADLGALRDLITSSGLRWAWDADDRARHDQPAVDQNTVRFALDRLALGVLMPDPGGVAVLPAAHGFGPAVPVDLPGRDHAERFGTLAEVCDRLQRLQPQLATSATAGAWRARLEAVIDAFCAVPESRAWQRTRVSTTLQELLADEAADGADAALELDPTSIAAMLRDAFTLPRGGDRPSTGAVTVCAMEPMRSVPFRVVAMIGMDDDSFPRPSRPPAWDPFAAAKPQEHDRRSLDRHLFLESLLCARDALLVYGRGFEAARGEDVPLSVVVEELADLLAGALGISKPRDLLRVHPLQPWSLKAFEDGARRPFDATWAEAARAHQGERRLSGLAATPAEAEWPPETDPPSTLTARELARALENAPRAFLEKTLGLSMRDKDTAPEDREPIELDHLEAWRLRDALIDIVRESAEDITIAPLLQRQQGLGAIPFEAGGEVLLQGELAAAQDIADRAEAIEGERLSSAPYEVCVTAEDCAPLRLTATLTDIRLGPDGRHTHVWTLAGKDPKDPQLLEVFVSMLVAVAAGAPVREAVIVAGGGATPLQAPSSEAARSILSDIVILWWQLRRRPIALVARFSREIAAYAAGHPDETPEEVVLANAETWFERDDGKGAMDDRAARLLFGALTDRDLESRAPEFLALATRVWRPLSIALGEVP